MAVAITDSGMMNCGPWPGSWGARLKRTPPFDGVAYIIPWGVWYSKGESMEAVVAGWMPLAVGDVGVVALGDGDADVWTCTLVFADGGCDGVVEAGGGGELAVTW